MAGHPKVRVTAETVEEAIDLLEERIADDLHDAVPHLEFIKPLPSAKPDFLFALAGHHRVETVLNVAELFQHPECRVCDNWSGPRTDALIQLPEKPIGDLDFTWELGYLVSAKLAKFLGFQECPDLRLRPVVIAGKETVDFLEIWSTHPRPGVAIKGVKASRGGFRCQTCGRPYGCTCLTRLPICITWRRNLCPFRPSRSSPFTKVTTSTSRWTRPPARGHAQILEPRNTLNALGSRRLLARTRKADETDDQHHGDDHEQLLPGQRPERVSARVLREVDLHSSPRQCPSGHGERAPH